MMRWSAVAIAMTALVPALAGVAGPGRDGVSEGHGAGALPPSIDRSAALSPAARIGRALFFDTSLSASGRMACSTCHDPQFAYGPPNDRAVQLGGPTLSDAGTRAVPSLRY
jgi:cytochrome c peroxidase